MPALPFLLPALNAFLFSLLNAGNYLAHNVYPVFSPEALALTACLFLAVLTAGFLCQAVKMGWLFNALLIFIFLDLHLGFANPPFWSRWLTAPVPHAAFWNHVLAALMIGGLAYRLRNAWMDRLVFAMLLLMGAATLIQYRVAPASLVRITENKAVPAGPAKPEDDVLIFILDEHAGLEGIPALGGEGSRFRGNVAGHYRQRGFAVYAQAYSNYCYTQNSIPSLLNHVSFERNDEGDSLKQNQLLEKLLSQGFELRIYQTGGDFFCAAFEGRVRQCVETRANSAGYLRGLPLTRREKFFFLADSFVSAHQSEILKRLRRRTMDFFGREIRDSSGPVPAMQVFERLKADFEAAPRGSVFFVHVMMPHYPYVYDEACRVKKMQDWINRDRDGFGNTPAEWEVRIRQHLKQAACLDRQMKEVFEALDKTGRFEKASIVVFSDHGSRITLAPPIAEKTAEFKSADWQACFSAFAAVKKGTLLGALPLPEGGLVEGRIPLAQLLNDLFKFSPRGSSETERKFSCVYLRKNWETSELQSLKLPEEERD